MSDFFFILGELTCRRDIDYLCWINIDTLKASTSVTNKDYQIEFTLLVNSLANFYETNKKLFIQFAAKIQLKQFFYYCRKKLLRTPNISITEALMTSSTHFPKEKTGLHLGNNQQHNRFIKFLKQHKFGVSGTTLDDYTNFSCAFKKLLKWITCLNI